MASISNTAAGTGAGLGLGAAGLDMLFNNWKNPADAAMSSIDSIGDTISPYYSPYINSGTQMLPELQNQYTNLLNNPTDIYNKFGSAYQQSPGFDFALKQALAAAGNAAAAGGMAGSPMAQQQNMQIATGMANQDFNNYMQNILNMYGMGMQGGQNMAGLGFNASNELAQSLANALLSKANLQYSGQAAQNQHDQGFFGNILGAISNFLPKGLPGLPSP